MTQTGKIKQKSERKKSEKKEKRREAPRRIVFSLLTEESVELSYEHRCKVLIASTLKRCYSNTRGILRIVNILEDFTNTLPPSPPQRKKNEVFQLFPISSY